MGNIEGRPNDDHLWNEEMDDLGSLDALAHDNGTLEFDLRIGGKTTWRMALDTQGIARPCHPDFVLEEARYQLSRPLHYNDVGSMQDLTCQAYYKCYSRCFISHAFRWKYVMLYDDVWDIGTVCERLTFAQSSS